ncbi:ABC transporter permease [Sphingobacterium suaedae]|uniref:ABC transporter permease n=1 Tax=Sphingobacterium suaedae TaxID=1686402 RepID=A0ABW5KIQ3_9SPHI
MIKNFFRSAIRNLRKTKGYSFLNIFGLALGIAVTALIFLWVEDEVSWNDHFVNKKDIYITKSKQTYDGNINVFEATPAPFAQEFQRDFPEVLHAGRMYWGSSSLFSVGDKQLYQFGYYADPAILSILMPEFLEGTIKSALNDPSSVVLSESASMKLFGTTKTVGKTVKFDNSEVYTISAVTKDFPKNSSFKYDWLIDFKKLEASKPEFGFKNWGNNSVMTLVQLDPTADLTAVNAKLKYYIDDKQGSKEHTDENFLYPMERWKMYNTFKQGIEQEGKIKSVRLFTSIAWLVLLIACINFMNLSTARSEKRAKEVGMRKIVGAKRRTLILQFLGESLIFAGIAGLIAVGLVKLGLPFFNTFVYKELTIDLKNSYHLGFLSIITLVCGVISGSYPAFFLSSFDPLRTIKGTRKVGSGSGVRKTLVVTQFTAAIILMICTSIIYLQVQHAKNRDLGFERSHVIMTDIQGEMFKHMDVIKQELKATGQIESVGLSITNVLNVGSNTSDFEWDGKDPKSSILIGFTFVDPEFTDALSITINDGRNFRPNFLGDSSSILINESYAKLIQPDGLVAGKTIKMNNIPFTIVGVVNNYVYNDIYGTAEPLVLAPLDVGYAYGYNGGIMNIKIKPHVSFQDVIAQIESIVKKYNPEFPFSYRPLDESFDSYFGTEMMLQKLASLFAILAIIISCLGLLGLAAYAAEQRAREVSIRKVLGASVGRLVKMLNYEFLVLVGVACLIAFPIAWYFMNDWLMGYNYHMEMPWIIFLFVAGLSLAIATITISSQALRAATSNPTKTLRNE